MRFLVWAALAGFVLLALFAAANWSLLTAPATLSFLVFSLVGPLGLILLAVNLGFFALFAIYAMSVRTGALVDARRHTRQLDAQRELADKAEASRFTALTARLEDEFAQTRARMDELRAELLRRDDAVEQSIIKSLDEISNSLSAYVGEVDDKLNRLTARGNDRS